MRVLITGAGGFIGTWLTKELERNGYDVVGLDVEKTRPSILVADIGQTGYFEAIVRRVQPDVVFHLAAQVGRIFGERDLIHTVRANGELTTIIANVCGKYGIRMLYTSSSEIYGDPGLQECDEIDGPFTIPHNLYGLTKRWGEEAAKLYAPAELTILRLSMPYGPGVPPGVGRRAMDTMLWQAHHRMPIIVHRGGERSWCWVGDTVRALRMTLEQTQGGIFNVGRDDDPRPMVEIARMACDLTDAPYSLIEEVDPPAAQTVVKRLRTDRIRDLGWKPTVELAEGIEKVYNWVKNFDENGVLNDNVVAESFIQ